MPGSTPVYEQDLVNGKPGTISTGTLGKGVNVVVSFTATVTRRALSQCSVRTCRT